MKGLKTPLNIAYIDSVHNGREEEAFPCIPGSIAEQETFFLYSKQCRGL